MKRLTLLRHAKSSHRDDGLADLERPLSARGERDAPAIAERLAARGARPALILTSHAARAKSTARIVAGVLGCSDAVRVEPALYLASPDDLLAIVHALDDRLPEALLVGHNPGLTDLANRLLPDLGGLDDLPTAGVVAVESKAETWAGVGRSRCRLLYRDVGRSRTGSRGGHEP